MRYCNGGARLSKLNEFPLITFRLNVTDRYYARRLVCSIILPHNQIPNVSSISRQFRWFTIWNLLASQVKSNRQVTDFIVNLLNIYRKSMSHNSFSMNLNNLGWCWTNFISTLPLSNEKTCCEWKTLNKLTSIKSLMISQ